MWSPKYWGVQRFSTAPETIQLGGLATSDLEHGPSDKDTTLHQRALLTLFGLDPSHLTIWPGLTIFFNHLESCFQYLLESRFHCIWNMLSRTIPSTPDDVWHWCFAVLGAYESTKEQDPSIEKIYSQLCMTARRSAPEGEIAYVPTDEDKRIILQAIFAVLCWTSASLRPLLGDMMNLRPVPDLESEASSDGGESFTLTDIALIAENSSYTYSSTVDDLRRPLSKMFNQYQPRASERESRFSTIGSPGDTSQSHTVSSEDMLYAAVVDYSSLCTIGRVRITWVDTLTAHLAFDPGSRELSVYRYPSLCATKIMSKHKVLILDKITESLLAPQFRGSLADQPAAVYREVLLSYRLLFGQSHASRKLLLAMIKGWSNHSTPDSHRLLKADHSEKVDPFLKTLCTVSLYSGWRSFTFGLGKHARPRIEGSLFPLSALTVDDELIESDTYSAQDDFPTFGNRLLALQRYNMRRQPSKVRDLWRDRRNPLQWYTFWAVIVVGAVGLLLAFLQLAVGLVQMAYAIHPVK